MQASRRVARIRGPDTPEEAFRCSAEISPECSESFTKLCPPGGERGSIAALRGHLDSRSMHAFAQHMSERPGCAPRAGAGPALGQGPTESTFSAGLEGQKMRGVR